MGNKNGMPLQNSNNNTNLPPMPKCSTISPVEEIKTGGSVGELEQTGDALYFNKTDMCSKSIKFKDLDIQKKLCNDMMSCLGTNDDFMHVSGSLPNIGNIMSYKDANKSNAQSKYNKCKLTVETKIDKYNKAIDVANNIINNGNGNRISNCYNYTAIIPSPTETDASRAKATRDWYSSLSNLDYFEQQLVPRIRNIRDNSGYTGDKCENKFLECISKINTTPHENIYSQQFTDVQKCMDNVTANPDCKK